MLHLRKATAAIGAAAVLTVPLAALAASPASAAETSGSCGGARFELSVTRDDGGFEVEADIEEANPGSEWRLVLAQDGNRFFNRVRTANGQGDISVDRNRPNTAGKDVFRIKVKKVGTDNACRRTITMR